MTSEGRPGLTYRAAGVDVDAKARLLDRLGAAVTSTHSPAVALGAGAFAGAIGLPAGTGFLVATTDGVGTKALLARRWGRDAVVGADVVAHAANDLVCSGGRPLAFLDYVAMARLDAAVVATLVEAMAEACGAVGAVLLGGETAEMPDVYTGDAYDVVGTMIGVAPPDGLITGATVRPGDRIVGLASTGLHTNGYSLARRVVDQAGIDPDAPDPRLGTTAADALLQPHRCYAPAMLSLLERVRVAAIAHITGGGLPSNLARVLPEGCRGRLAGVWPRPPVFDWLQRVGGIADDEMRQTFNLGVGMALIVRRRDEATVLEHFARAALAAFPIGEVVEGPRGVDGP
ncbi:MAG: phosphoribosylformylglycinamidine cyclo-ligase [Armatimonadota bacterium]|nr:phosphoribosylformylglycinamidine cyclo-ligase [Armatimonadota bacterium]MDR7454865.1 phosphoribosylformylglycinamidine cyclo-ligase [Armatimonadota bacterium]MDR7457814.1 phosphoribosylformylglycinamidine cyclo-ligase [Armatimonadota bacterium]MDR7512803.1 phosphoribosylformylglycinamidine cyclo-ligase [Armatimonadota bacterium]